MNFQNLSVEGYAAFILAIIFSIVCIASFLYFAKHKDLNKTAMVVIGFVFPMVTIFCWSYFFMTIFEWSMALSLAISFGVAVGYGVLMLIILGIAYLIIKAVENHKANKAAKIEEETETTETAVEQTEETENAPVEAVALLTTSEQVAEQEENVEEQAEVEETTEEQEQPVEEEQPEEVAEEVETTEETVEETTEETAESEEAETTEEAVEGEENIDEESEEFEQGVIFSNEPKKTFEEQLSLTDAEIVGYYNEIMEYAEAKPKTRRFSAKYQIAIKIGRWRLMLVKFVRGKLVCNFMAGSSELKNYSLQEKNVKIKEKPVIVEIDSPESVVAAKNMIDITYKNIDDAVEEKLALKKAERKAKRDAEKAANAEEAKNSNETEDETNE